MALQNVSEFLSGLKSTSEEVGFVFMGMGLLMTALRIL